MKQEDITLLEQLYQRLPPDLVKKVRAIVDERDELKAKVSRIDTKTRFTGDEKRGEWHAD